MKEYFEQQLELKHIVDDYIFNNVKGAGYFDSTPIEEGDTILFMMVHQPHGGYLICACNPDQFEALSNWFEFERMHDDIPVMRKRNECSETY